MNLKLKFRYVSKLILPTRIVHLYISEPAINQSILMKQWIHQDISTAEKIYTPEPRISG